MAHLAPALEFLQPNKPHFIPKDELEDTALVVGRELLVTFGNLVEVKQQYALDYSQYRQRREQDKSAEPPVQPKEARLLGEYALFTATRTSPYTPIYTQALIELSPMDERIGSEVVIGSASNLIQNSPDGRIFRQVAGRCGIKWAPTISPEHLAVEALFNGIFVIDLDSEYGTVVLPREDTRRWEQLVPLPDQLAAVG